MRRVRISQASDYDLVGELLDAGSPEAVKAKFLPDSDYAHAKSVDWGQMESMQKGFVDRYLAEVR